MNPGTEVAINVLALAFALVWAVVYIVSYCWSRRYNERVSTIRRLGFSIIESERIAQHLARAKWVMFRG